MTNYFHPMMDMQSIGAISSLGLAHIGDAVYELLVRTWLCTHGKVTSHTLHRATVQFVSAPAQAAVLERLLPRLTPEEIAISIAAELIRCRAQLAGTEKARKG